MSWIIGLAVVLALSGATVKSALSSILGHGLLFFLLFAFAFLPEPVVWSVLGTLSVITVIGATHQFIGWWKENCSAEVKAQKAKEKALYEQQRYEEIKADLGADLKAQMDEWYDQHPLIPRP